MKNNLRVFRWKAGFTKAYEFAQKVEIPGPTLSIIEHGRQNPRQDLKITIVNILDQALRAKGEITKPLDIEDVFPNV